MSKQVGSRITKLSSRLNADYLTFSDHIPPIIATPRLETYYYSTLVSDLMTMTYDHDSSSLSQLQHHPYWNMKKPEMADFFKLSIKELPTLKKTTHLLTRWSDAMPAPTTKAHLTVNPFESRKIPKSVIEFYSF
jgi:hypothetical protein